MKIRDKRNLLLMKSKGLKEANLGNCKKLTFEEILKVQENQNSIYRQWQFYDNYIKASEKF